MWLRGIVLVPFASTAMACAGPAASSPAPGASSPAPEASSASAAAGTAGSEANSDVQALLVDVIAPRLCDALRGSFVGLPGEGGSVGPAAGSDPTVGRWWIRECRAEVRDDRLNLAIAGTGWTWVDRESMGFRVRQYLRFDAHAAFSATMEVGYDRAARVATIWIRPGPEVQAGVTPRGLVQAEATNPLAGMLGGILELTGTSASQRAQQQVAEEGSQRLRERFASGFTVTFAMDEQQMDFMVGALGRGEVPIRPYPPEPGVVWSINQRMQIWPGGLDVLGPLPDGRGEQAVDLELEEGEGTALEVLCASDFERYYDQLLQGASPTMPRGTPVLEIAQAGGAARATIPQLGCPSLLLVTPRQGATLPSRMRVRVTPADAPTATARARRAGADSAATAGSVGGAGAFATDASRPVRIQIAALTVSPQSPSGSRWDLLGGEPDPYVVIVSIPGQREIERTQVFPDRHEVPSMDHWLPGAYRAEDLPIRFTVYDDDVAGDELVGVGDLVAAQLAAGGDVHVELRSQQTVPRAMGLLRLRVHPVQ